MSLRFLGGFCPRTGPGALPERAGWHRGALTLTRAPLRDCIIHGKALGEKKVGKKPTKRWGNVTVLAVTIQTQPQGPQGHLAARLSVSPGCGGGAGRGSPEGPRRGRRVLPGKAGAAAGAAGRAVGGRRRHRAGRARPVGHGAVPPGAERHRVVRGTERWKFPVGIAMAVGKEQSPCFGLGLFSVGVEGRGRRRISLPRLCSLPARHVPAAGRAGRRPCRHREGFSADCRFGFCTVSLWYYFYFVHIGGSPGQNSACGGAQPPPRCPPGPARRGRGAPAAPSPPARPGMRRHRGASSLASSPLVLLCGVGGFVVFFPDGEREGG